MTSPGGSINLNEHAPSYSFTPDADVGTASSYLDGGGIVPALGQQDYRVIRAGAQEDDSLSLLNVESAGEFYRIPGLPIQRGAAEEQLRTGKALVVGLIVAGVVVLTPYPLAPPAGSGPASAPRSRRHPPANHRHPEWRP